MTHPMLSTMSRNLSNPSEFNFSHHHHQKTKQQQQQQTTASHITRQNSFFPL